MKQGVIGRSRATWGLLAAGTLAFFLASGLLAPRAHAYEGDTSTVVVTDDGFKDPRVQVVVGGGVTLGNENPTDYRPNASVLVDWNLAGRTRALDAHVQADFTALPDTQITFRDARQFDGLELSLGVSYKPIPTFSAAGYCETGFASRLQRDAVQAVTSAPLWSSCGLRFEDRGRTRARLTIGIGPDERLGYGWQIATHVKASIRLIEKGRVGSTIQVRAILGLETPAAAPQRTNIVTVSVGLSWDSKATKK